MWKVLWDQIEKKGQNSKLKKKVDSFYDLNIDFDQT